MYLGIEIGGTKLQIGVGAGDGSLAGLWRGNVDIALGPEGIRRQIAAAIPELIKRSGTTRRDLQSAGIGFGGPVDDSSRRIIKSHQIAGWDNFPVADWMGDLIGLPCALGNDADVAGLAEALYGAGKGFSPLFYITIGSGIGGGLIIEQQIYRGCGRGAAEIGHLAAGRHDSTDKTRVVVELEASGWAIQERARRQASRDPKLGTALLRRSGGDPARITAEHVAEAARQGDPLALDVLQHAWTALAEAICHVVALLCPRRIVIGGGVSMMGENLFFKPLRQMVAARVFKPFAGSFDIVAACLGEDVVVHGAIALARNHGDG
jgi:glucokinase